MGAVRRLLPSLALLLLAEHGWAADVDAPGRLTGEPDVPPSSALAQPPAPEPETAPEPLEEVTVDAAPRTEPHAPSGTVVPRRVLELAPQRSADSLLRFAPGLTLSRHGGEGKPAQLLYRGFDAAHGQDLEVTLGGLPLNEVSNLHGQGYVDLGGVMPEAVERLQLEPGPYDARQGDFAVAGSLGLELGWAEPGLTTQLSVGSFAERRLLLGYRPKGAPSGTFAAFEAHASDGYGKSRASRRSGALAQWEHRLGDVSLRLLGGAHTARFDSAGVLRLDDVEQGRVDRWGSYLPGSGGDSSRFFFGAELRDGGREGSASLMPFIQQRSLRLRSNFTGFLVDPVHGDALQQTERRTTLGLRGSYGVALPLLSARDRLEAGLYARSDAIEQAQLRLAAADDSVVTSEVDASVSALDLAGWLELRVHPLSWLAVRAGLRADGLGFATQDHGGHAHGAEEHAGGHARSAQGTHLGKKADLVAALGAGFSAVLAYGEGFRSPQARSLGDGERAPFASARSGELGLRYAGRGLYGTLSGFLTRLDSDLSFDETTGRNEAVPGTERRGLAATLVALPTDWFTSSTSLTFTHAAFHSSGGRFRAGDLLPNVPARVARTDLGVQHVVTRLLGRELQARAGLGLGYQGGKPLPYGEVARDSVLVDGLLGARLQELELRLDVENLLDTAWFDGEYTYASSFRPGAQASLLPARHVSVGPPRQLLLTLALHL